MLLKFVKKFLWKSIPRRYYLPFMYYYINYKSKGSLKREMSILKDIVGSGNAIDAGANIGLYSYVLAKLCKSVEAFEPNPACASALEDYGASNIKVHVVGLSSEECVKSLHIPIVNGLELRGWASFSLKVEGEQKIIEVPVKRLDDYHFIDVSFIKIDVEGH